ncbi:GNAT family N-acetyltransferase [Glycomyces algeriensis]|uniref:N-acetyltransferase n=1 Tax=Glycomyces algeriensis TaxID=256037 RepID=A0A9W6G937_9ACTN|nr:N-acetyltransferase [Glycomyces algeriensis]MDA1365087.1 N-acetyltransferase [Glycomyces algeriensis]MDR7349851.1 ribosomal protein S18 acetylase RimI-like enzyme [Glycomyces algeriensis]GLI42562.1 N-acetyltransferase [Glycomyces algeriensis]
MRIRDARPEDWPAVWAFAEPIIASGEHFVWEGDTSEERLRAYWIEKEAPASALVAVLEDGTGDNSTGQDGTGADVAAEGRVVGIAEIHPNQPGRGSHIANAGFMVDPAVRGQGVGRALGEAALARAKADGFAAMQFNAVVATNTRAVDLWHALGFRTLAVLPGTFRHPVQGLVGMHLMFREL